MLIEWLGHSAFLLVTSSGKKIITDPYEAGAFQGTLNYGPIRIAPDIVTVSHQHADHGSVEELPGEFEVVSRAGERTINGIRIKGVESYHDAQEGALRGMNVIFVIEMDGMRVCHLGDLGQVLTPRQIEEIGPVDILLIPVGGYYTINADEADDVIRQLNPRLAIPMHFKTDKVDFPIKPVSDFISGRGDVQVRPASEIEITREQLPEHTMILVLQHAL